MQQITAIQNESYTRKPRQIWSQSELGDKPIIAAAVHNGHSLRPDAQKIIKVDGLTRHREEDPYTAAWTHVTDTQIIGLYSRFEVDLNRARGKAVYRKPEDAWGLEVYPDSPESCQILKESLEAYDAFYKSMHELFSRATRKFAKFAVLDIHTYNHRRDGADSPPAPQTENPEINIGTATMTSPQIWRPLVDRFIKDLSEFDYLGRQLDVRENVKFQGGHFANWIHRNFPGSACVLSIEVKKFFMDEWTGELFDGHAAEIYKALRSTLPGLEAELEAVKRERN